jgi:phosphate-selective porin OprO/OprP
MLLLGAEAAFVYGPFSVQAEYVLCDVDAPTQGDPVYSGWYAQASWFLTGECRTYERGRARFGMVRPCRPFFCEDCGSMGSGAWEIAARFSTVDLNDGDVAVRGGEEWNATVGVTWYVNNNVRVMLNYVHAEIDDHPAAVDGTVDGIGLRVAAIW